MKNISLLPTEFKAKDKDKAAGSYLLEHPFIKKYFIAIEVFDEPDQERVSITLVCLVSATKKLFRNVTRYPTFDDLVMVRFCFFNEDEEVIQFVQENQEELARGHFFSNLIKLKK